MFRCPDCSLPTLDITHSIEMPAELRSDSDELSLQVIACGTCALAGVAVYAESRRGGLDDEVVNHDGYRAAAGATAVKALIERCPARANPRCTCEAHRILAARDADGQWSPGVALRSVPSFVMRYEAGR